MPFDFAEVFRREIDVINFRRHAIQDGRVISARAGLRASASKGRAAPRRTGYTVPRADAELVSGDAQAADREPVSTTPESNLTGLALSGGGVRSASLCLGVLQALDSLCGEDEPEPLDAFDYISAVSGGGYIGTSLVAGLLQSNGSFPFDSKLDQQETPETQHLRDFSNFLAPNGMVDYLVSAALILRGLLVNAVITLPVLLILAAVTIASNPLVADLTRSDISGASVAGWPLPLARHPRDGAVHAHLEPGGSGGCADVRKRHLHIADIRRQHIEIARGSLGSARVAAADRAVCRAVRGAAIRNLGHDGRRPRSGAGRAHGRANAGCAGDAWRHRSDDCRRTDPRCRRAHHGRAKAGEPRQGLAGGSHVDRDAHEVFEPKRLVSCGVDRAAAALGHLHLSQLLGDPHRHGGRLRPNDAGLAARHFVLRGGAAMAGHQSDRADRHAVSRSRDPVERHMPAHRSQCQFPAPALPGQAQSRLFVRARAHGTAQCGQRRRHLEVLDAEAARAGR